MTKYFDSNINLRDSLVEMFAVFGLVFFSLGAGALGNFYSGDKTLSESNILNTFITASTSGFYIFIAVASFSRISGAHINPAVTISMWIHKKISSKKALFYLLAQFAGGILELSLENNVCCTLRSSFISSEIFMTSIILGLSLELVCTAFLAIVIFSTLNSESHFMAAFSIGVRFLRNNSICHLQAADESCKIICPAVAFGEYRDIWIYCWPNYCVLLAHILVIYLRW